jgi:hypothetical protein
MAMMAAQGRRLSEAYNMRGKCSHRYTPVEIEYSKLTNLGTEAEPVLF